jgi:hypothetical protein
MFSDRNAFPIEEMKSEAIDNWLTPVPTKEKGALILRGEGPVAPETETLAAKHWPEAAPRVPVKLEGGHTVEAVIQNQGGEGILALEPFMRPEPAATSTGEDTSTEGASDQLAEAPEPDAAPKAEAEPATETPGAEAPAESNVEKEEESVAGLMEYASEIRALGDFTDAGDFKLTIIAHAKDAANADLAKTLLDGLRDVTQTDMKEDEITVTGATTVNGNVVTGDIIFSGFKERFTKWLHEMQQSRY